VPFYYDTKTDLRRGGGLMAMSKVHVHATLKVRIGRL